MSEKLDFYADDMFGNRLYDYRPAQPSPVDYRLEGFVPENESRQQLVFNFQGSEPAVILDQPVKLALYMEYDANAELKPAVHGCTYTPPP